MSSPAERSSEPTAAPVEAAAPTVSVVVPTLGRSPYLGECLRRLRTSGGDELEILVVAQGPEAESIEAPDADEILRRAENLGFAGGCNLGIRRSTGDYVGLVNDDALVEPGWIAALVGALDGDPGAAAAQGPNRQLHAPGRIDGCGIGWNTFWRPVQLGYDAPAEEIELDSAPREIFGTSATACLYRRSALDGTALDGGEVLEPLLRSYYEDVELAVRLRHAGHRALLVPGADACHVGSQTSRQFPEELTRLLFSNRYLVVARLLGRERAPAMRRLRTRDRLDRAGALLTGRLGTSRAIGAGWQRAGELLPEFAHEGPPALDAETLAPFRVRRARDFR